MAEEDSAQRVEAPEVPQEKKGKGLEPSEPIIPLRSLWGEGAKPLATEYSEKLPSQGLLYKDEDGEPILPDGSIVLRPLTTREEGILYAQSDAVEKMHSMVSACIVTKGLKAEDLLVIDQFYLLLSLRVHSFGSEYEIPIRCQYCREQAKVKINLTDDLNMRYINETASEPFKFDLPVSGKSIGFRLMRVRDQFRIRQHTKRMRMQTVDPTDPSHQFRLALTIVEIDGVEIDLSQAQQFVRTMHMGDSNALQNEIDRVEGGVDTRIYPECPHCGAANQIRMPFELEFFRPGAV